MANQIDIIRTEKGENGVCYNGFTYRYDSTLKNNKISWRCLERKECRGRIWTDNDATYSNAVERHPHCHVELQDKCEVLRVKTAIRKRATEENIGLCAIYRQETARLAANPVAAAIMPAYRSMSSTMNRDRLSTLPPLPATRQAIVVPPQYQRTANGQQFLLCTGMHHYINTLLCVLKSFVSIQINRYFM